jgi:hypothetical protein
MRSSIDAQPCQAEALFHPETATPRTMRHQDRRTRTADLAARPSRSTCRPSRTRTGVLCAAGQGLLEHPPAASAGIDGSASTSCGGPAVGAGRAGGVKFRTGTQRQGPRTPGGPLPAQRRVSCTMARAEQLRQCHGLPPAAATSRCRSRRAGTVSGGRLPKPHSVATPKSATTSCAAARRRRAPSSPSVRCTSPR